MKPDHQADPREPDDTTERPALAVPLSPTRLTGALWALTIEIPTYIEIDESIEFNRIATSGKPLHRGERPGTGRDRPDREVSGSSSRIRRRTAPTSW